MTGQLLPQASLILWRLKPRAAAPARRVCGRRRREGIAERPAPVGRRFCDAVVRLGDREPRDNPRFVVTNMRQTPRFLYEKVYCARGDVENRIKELKDLQLDRTSCCRLRANQLRVFLTAAAYVLMQELRLHAARTACARTQVMWLRDRLLKLSVHVVSSVRRLVLHLPRSTPNLDAWRKIALSLGRAPGNASNASLDPPCTAAITAKLSLASPP